MQPDPSDLAAARSILGRAEAFLDVARKLVSEEETAHDYYGEKAALKFVAFFEKDLELLRQYVEMKLYYPALAEKIELMHPDLGEKWRLAKDPGSETPA